MVAAWRRCEAVVELLIDRGASLFAANPEGQAVVHCLCAGNLLAPLKFLHALHPAELARRNALGASVVRCY